MIDHKDFKDGVKNPGFRYVLQYFDSIFSAVFIF